VIEARNYCYHPIDISYSWTIKQVVEHLEKSHKFEPIPQMTRKLARAGKHPKTGIYRSEGQRFDDNVTVEHTEIRPNDFLMLELVEIDTTFDEGASSADDNVVDFSQLNRKEREEHVRELWR
jgi:hypothetical protein